MTNKLLFIFFLLLFLVPTLASALNCNLLDSSIQDDCQYLVNNNQSSLVANLIYSSNSFSNHNFIQSHNDERMISISPDNTTVLSNSVIKSAWLKILTIQPSISYYESLFVPENIVVRTEYNYDVQVPSNYYNNRKRDGATCKILKTLNSNNADLQVSDNSQFVGSIKQTNMIITKNTTINSKLDISVIIKNKKYEWDRYCCRRVDGHCVRHCYKCKYDKTFYDSYSLTVSDAIDVFLFEEPTWSTFNASSQPSSSQTYKGRLSSAPLTNNQIITSNAFFEKNTIYYYAEFNQEPYSFLQLSAVDDKSINSRNVINTANSLYFSNVDNCEVKTNSFFSSHTEPCIISNNSSTEEMSFLSFESQSNWGLLFKVILLILFGVFFFKILRHYGKKASIVAVIFIFALIMFSAPVSATPPPSSNISISSSCGITNLGSCLPQTIFDFTLNLFNAPLEPLLDLVKNLLETPVNIAGFHAVWAIIIYCLSLFYSFLIMYSGFQFLTAGHNVLRREMAKQWLKNTLIMIVLIQSSFYLYGLIIDIGSLMTSSILQMVDPTFFLLTANNFINVGLEFIFTFMYVLTLLFTLLLLVIRYLTIAFGVLFIPIGIFCYFIPPLKSYGKLIINILLLNIFITFLSGVIILGCAQLINIPLFANVEILVMINCFSIINILFFILIRMAIQKSAVGEGAEKMAQAAKYIAMMA